MSLQKYFIAKEIVLLSNIDWKMVYGIQISLQSLARLGDIYPYYETRKFKHFDDLLHTRLQTNDIT